MNILHGRQKLLAAAAGVPAAFLNDIVQGRKRCPSSLAVKLEMVSEDVLGYRVTSSEWILAGLGLNKKEGGASEGQGT